MRSTIATSVTFEANPEAVDQLYERGSGLTSVESVTTSLSGEDVRVIVRGVDEDGEPVRLSVCVGWLRVARKMRAG